MRIEDPDPRVSGRGLDRLRAAGIEVERGVGAAEARWLTRGHIVRVTERRPFVTFKLALDGSGEIARGDGVSPVWVTGEIARAHGMLLRARSDAILVGSATVRDDDPELTCRLPGLFDRSPVRVVLSTIAWTFRRVPSSSDPPATFLCGSSRHSRSIVERREEIASRGAEIIDAAVVGGQLWLPSVMEALVARGITRLLVEGGPVIWRAFAVQRLSTKSFFT